MKNHRPINLNLFTIRFPIPAIASILHRASGLILFLAIPIFLWVLSASLSSSQRYDEIYQMLAEPFCKLVIWGLLSAFFYHFVAGIRHLLMDINVGISLKSGRLSALITILLAVLIIVLTGIWVW